MTRLPDLAAHGEHRTARALRALNIPANPLIVTKRVGALDRSRPPPIAEAGESRSAPQPLGLTLQPARSSAPASNSRLLRGEYPAELSYRYEL